MTWKTKKYTLTHKKNCPWLEVHFSPWFCMRSNSKIKWGEKPPWIDKPTGYSIIFLHHFTVFTFWTVSNSSKKIFSYFTDLHSRSMKMLSMQRPLPSILIWTPWSFNALVKALPAYCGPWLSCTQFQASGQTDWSSRPANTQQSIIQNLLVIRKVFCQQKEIIEQHSQRVDDSIVSISQAHVRPIVRG